MEIKLSAKHATALRRPINGNGGFQSFLRKLQNHLSLNNVLTVTLAELARARRLRRKYGAGGFQGRLAWVEV